jgi:3-dehydroquinate dehydratase-2
MKILVLHGPNLNLLGEREPEVYGSMTLGELNAQIAARCAELSVEVEVFQSNHEGALIDALHDARTSVDGVVFNPGAFTHYSYALRDAVAGISPPVVEVHLSDIHAREAFRQVSVIADVCLAQISGKGAGSYLEAIELLVERGDG